MVFFFFFHSLKCFKIFFIQILYSYYKYSSIHTNEYHLSFIQISNFLLITINKFKCLVGFQLLIVLYLIFKHYSTLPYLLFFFSFLNTLSLLSIATLNHKNKL